MIDRYSSTTLNRPFAIQDSDIEIGFPIDVDDEVIIASSRLYPNVDAFAATYSPIAPAAMSVFLHCVRLRQISSRIHTDFSKLMAKTADKDHPKALLLTGHVYTTVNQLLSDLKQWRSMAPYFEFPQCQYERQEWYDLLHAREQLQLVRRAVDLVPKQNGTPPTPMLDLCRVSAIRVIELYGTQYHAGSVTYTRSYFQLMFTAGLSTIFCVTVSKDMNNTILQECINAMKMCERTLEDMAEKLPDAKHYMITFGALHRNLISKLGDVPLDSRAWTMTTGVPNHAKNAAHGEVPMEGLNARVQHFSQLNGEEHYSQVSGSDQAIISPNIQFASDSFILQSGSHSLPSVSDEASYDDPLQWAFLNDGTMWDMEAGLGAYAYGNFDDMTWMMPSFHDYSHVQP
jgi:hypothetical protein